LRIDGAFNINSTSVDAWRAILSQSTPEGGLWSLPLDSSRSRNLAFNRYFTRLPSGALQLTSGLNEDQISDASTREGRREALRHGYRTFAGGAEGANQLHQLAYHIVEQIKDFGRPFTSLAEFINSGVLEDAISEVGPATTNPAIPSVTPINQGREGYEPTFLRQTDLVANLAPLMAARSDTFKIRVKANSFSPQSGRPTSSATLEATVQRELTLPPDLDPETSPTLADYERGFRIVNLSWQEN
jgi:hypothetical protein